MQSVLASTGIPTPPATPPFDHRCARPPQQQQRPSFVPQRPLPVAPEDRIGTFLGNGSLQLTGILGTGAYGVVYAAVDVHTHTPYAVKALSKLNADGTPLDARQIDYQTREIRLHYQASAHPNVVSMYKIFDGYPDCLFVVLEYCPEGDLFYNITECGRFVGHDELARSMFLQIVDAVQFLHQAGIYHRDLKPENILVTDHGRTVKIADFGLATSADRSEDYGCGSTFYMSPECLGQTNAARPYYYCAPNDVWSLGVILVNLTCGRNPWKQASQEDSTYRAYTRNAGFLKTILPLTDELDAILARIFTADPDQRISIAELKDRILACPRFTVPPSPPQQQQQPLPVVLPLTPPASPAASDYHPVFDEDDEFEDEEEDEEQEEDDQYEDALQADATAQYHLPLSPAPSEQEQEQAVAASASVDIDLDDDEDDGDDFYSTMGDNESEASFASAAQLPETPPPPMVVAATASGAVAEDACMVGGGARELAFQQQQQLEQQVAAAAAGVAAAAAAFQYQQPPQQQQQQHHQHRQYHHHHHHHHHTGYAAAHHPYAQPPPPQYLQPQQLPLPPPPVPHHHQQQQQSSASRFFPGVLGWMGMVGRSHCQAQQQHHHHQHQHHQQMLQHQQQQQQQQQSHQHYYMHHYMPMFHQVFLPGTH